MTRVSEWANRPVGLPPTTAELIDQVDFLSTYVLAVADLPLTDLQRKLEQDWQPDATVLLQPSSIGSDLLAPLPHVALASAGQSIAHGVFGAGTEIVWTVNLDRNDTMWTTGADVLLLRAGLWQINAAVQYPSNGTGSRLAAIFANGGEVNRSQGGNSGAADFAQATVGACRRFAAGTLIRVRAYQTSGGPLVVNAGFDCTWLGN